MTTVNKYHQPRAALTARFISVTRHAHDCAVSPKAKERRRRRYYAKLEAQRPCPERYLMPKTKLLNLSPGRRAK